MSVVGGGGVGVGRMYSYSCRLADRPSPRRYCYNNRTQVVLETFVQYARFDQNHNDENDSRVSGILADWPSPQPTTIVTTTAGRRWCRDVSTLCSVRQKHDEKRLFHRYREYFRGNSRHLVSIRAHAQQSTNWVWGRCWETTQ